MPLALAPMCLTPRQLQAASRQNMIDMFALLLVHGLLFLAAFRLMMDDTVDEDPALTGLQGDTAEQEPGA